MLDPVDCVVEDGGVAVVVLVVVLAATGAGAGLAWAGAGAGASFFCPSCRFASLAAAFAILVEAFSLFGGFAEPASLIAMVDRMVFVDWIVVGND